MKKAIKWALVSAATAVAFTALALGPTAPASSAPLHPALMGALMQDAADIVDVRAVAHRGGVAVGPRGGAVAYHGRAVVGRPGVVRPGGAAVVRRGAWVRPARYRWPVGGAIAAGAALGFVAAASAAAWAGAPPAPGMCWYYTDPSRTQGFWDYCPQ